MVPSSASPRVARRPSISAFVVCCNEERQIRRCLESVQWCEEIIVIDSGSTDATLRICQEFGARIIHRAWNGYAEQKAFGLSQCTSEWVLNLDADEEVSADLRKEIEERLSTPDVSSVLGFNLSRVVVYLGTTWDKGGWYPEYRLRLMRRTAARWGGDEPHERAFVDGPVARLRKPLFHYTHTGIEDHLATLNRFSSIAAAGLYKRGARASTLTILARPLGRFCKFYLLRHGYREGQFGLIVALLEAGYVFLKYAKLWELRRRDTIRSGLK